ncbi:MAG: hypothetical protein KDD47_06095 [Acidobacteria bacterium]|nr:hypothetical protein [Acidobacteriota bacterium]
MVSLGCNRRSISDSARVLLPTARGFGLALCLILAIGPSAHGLENDVGGDHLLRLLDDQRLADGRRVLDEILIFRDGVTVLLRTVGRNTRIFRADARPEEIEALKGLLVDEAVDLQRGACDLEGAPRVLSGPLGFRTRESWISWFGVGGRRARHLALGHAESESSPFGRPCTGAFERIVTAAFSFAHSVLSGPTATSVPDEHYPRSLLFSIRSDLQSDPACDPYVFCEDVYFFRDGLLLHHVVDSEGEFIYTRAQVPREMRQQLISVLAEERIGAIDTACRTWFFLPFAIDGACRDYTWQSAATWHGRDGRQGSIRGDDQQRDDCLASEIRVRSELLRLILAAVTGPSAAVVSGVFEGT